MKKKVIQAQSEVLARAIKRVLGKKVSHSECLEILAELYQEKSYNHLAHLLKAETAFSELAEFEKVHALANRDNDYENECQVSVLGNGRSLCTPAYPDEVDYVRVIDRAGHEVAYWTHDEWRDEPMEVMGAIVGALNGGVKRPIPEFVQTIRKVLP